MNWGFSVKDVKSILRLLGESGKNLCKIWTTENLLKVSYFVSTHLYVYEDRNIVTVMEEVNFLQIRQKEISLEVFLFKTYSSTFKRL